MMSRLLLPLLVSCILFSCGEAGPPESVTEDNAEAAAVSQDPSALTAEDLPVEQDAIAHTRNNSPETIDAEKLPAPAIREEPAATPPPAPKKPAKPAVDAADTEDQAAVKSMPAPKRPMETMQPEEEAPKTSPAPAAAPASVAPDHAPWNALLQAHVTSAGNVNYAAFKQNEAKLDAYLATLAAATPASDWSRNEAMAYWINAYNAFTIKRILNDHPVKSITDLDGGEPWKVKWIELDGKTYSLNQIEHDILRPQYQDARIHFAVNCAATSCPPLPNQAFTASNLHSLLQRSARSFINNSAYNQTSGEVKVSKIFEWYGEDFGDLREYLNKYLTEALPAGAEIGFKEYDWALNKQ